jgi:hypothetical protein
MHKRAVSNLIHGFGDEFIDHLDDDIWSSFNADDVHGRNHNLFILWLFSSPEGLHLVDLTKLSESFKELVRGASFLWLEERKPKNGSIKASTESCINICRKIVVDNIFEIDVIKFISPWMKNLETLVIHIL